MGDNEEPPSGDQGGQQEDSTQQDSTQQDSGGNQGGPEYDLDYGMREGGRGGERKDR
jgi:hypothetical protein